MTVLLAPPPETRDRMALVAAGRAPAELLIQGGQIVDVHAGQIRRADIAIVDGRVAAVAPDLSTCVGPSTSTIDADGMTITPGLVEPHTHLVRLGVAETARLQVAAGVTTTILEVGDLAYVCGPSAVRAIVDALPSLPGRLFVSVPPAIGIDELHEAKMAADDEWCELLDSPGVVGVGEIYWANLLRGHRRAGHLIARALDLGLAVEGHGAGAHGQALAAMAASGVGSDHEPISVGQVEARIRLGLYVYLREGVTRQDFDRLAPAFHLSEPSLNRLALCTDGVEPAQLLAGNALNSLVARAIRSGLSVPTAVRLACLVPAQRFGLTPWIGAIVPGALADIVLLNSVETFQPAMVLCSGAAPALPRAQNTDAWMNDTVRVRSFRPQVLAHPGVGSWRAMEISPEAPLVTREVRTDGSDAIVVVAIDRLGEARTFTGLLTGFGLHKASVASTVGADSRALLAVGDDVADLASAVERVEEMRGGVCVVSEGRELACWQARLGGLLSEERADVVAAEVGGVNRALREHGCPMSDPLLSLDFLTSPAVPHLRISPSGYVRFEDGAPVGLAWG